MDDILKGIGVIVLCITLCVGCTALGFVDHILGNKIEYAHNKIDEATDYDTIKTVEDTCRSMMASYSKDLLTYEQYKDSDNEEKQSWAEQAKMRANSTAATYNEYVIKNSFVWAGNVPSDIRNNLEYIE